MMIEVACFTCKKIFKRNAWRVKRAKIRFCSKACVNRSVAQKGINSNAKNGNWRGGKTLTNRGYKKILSKGHPRQDRDGYVLEHILVMEKKLGRLLRIGEVVHHKNHIKTDNRPENLELFKTHSEHLKSHFKERQCQIK